MKTFLRISLMSFLLVLAPISVRAQEIHLIDDNLLQKAIKETPAKASEFLRLIEKFAEGGDDALTLDAEIFKRCENRGISFYNEMKGRENTLQDFLASFTSIHNNRVKVSHTNPVFNRVVNLPLFDINQAAIKPYIEDPNEMANILIMTDKAIDGYLVYSFERKTGDKQPVKLELFYSLKNDRVSACIQESRKGGEFVAFTNAYAAFSQAQFDKALGYCNEVINGRNEAIKKEMYLLGSLLYAFVYDDFDKALEMAEKGKLDKLFINLYQAQHYALSNDWNNAIPCLEYICNSRLNNDVSQMMLGIALAQDPLREDEGVDMLKKLVDSDIPQVLAAVGFIMYTMYDYFEDLPENTGPKMIRKAAEKDLSLAYTMLSVIASDNDDEEEAYKWIVKPAVQGDAWSLARLGRYFIGKKQHGKGLYCLRRSLKASGFEKSLNYFAPDYWPISKAQIQNLVDQMVNDGIKPELPAELAETDEGSTSRTDSPRDVLEVLLKEAEKGNALAMARAGHMYMYGTAGVVNIGKADSLLNESLQVKGLLAGIKSASLDWPKSEEDVVLAINQINFAKEGSREVLKALETFNNGNAKGCVNILTYQADHNNPLAKAWLAKFIHEVEGMTAPEGACQALLQQALEDPTLPIYIGCTNGQLWPKGYNELKDYLSSVINAE